MNFFDHKDLGNHLLHLCPKVVKHPVYAEWLQIAAAGKKEPRYGGCPESIQPFWMFREPVAWPSFTLAASQRRSYCASVYSHCPLGLISRQWDAVDWACVLWPSHSQWPSEQISFITTIRLPTLQLLCRFSGKTSHHPVRSAPLQPRFGSLRLLAFPKAKIAVEKDEICEWTVTRYVSSVKSVSLPTD